MSPAGRRWMLAAGLVVFFIATGPMVGSVLIEGEPMAATQWIMIVPVYVIWTGIFLVRAQKGAALDGSRLMVIFAVGWAVGLAMAMISPYVLSAGGLAGAAEYGWGSAVLLFVIYPVWFGLQYMVPVILREFSPLLRELIP
ncbi:MAG: hypothetical protein GXP01_00105 [Alphaproteobacteria bacterium]|nr:hypothetical protein [Alphaproteobacteria bacterium]